MAEVSEEKPKSRKRRKEAMPISQEQLETVTARPDAIDKLIDSAEKRPVLNLHMPFATRKQQLTLLTKTPDGKLVFQGQKSGTVFSTDVYGFRVDGPKTGLQLVFNGIPEELRRTRTRNRFAIGDVVFTVRPMTKHRKIYAGMVEAFDAKGPVLQVLGTNDRDRFNAARTRTDGHVVVPYNLCFRTPEQVEMYIHKFQQDFERAKTDYRQLIESSRGPTH